MKQKQKASKPKGIWGLTGGIASGKSTVGQLLKEAGIPVVDADQIARELSAPGGEAEPLIAAKFGAISREELRDLIFRDPLARHDLEEILHPLIQEKSRQALELARLNSASEIAVYEAALLIEKNRQNDFDGLIVVVSDPSLQLLRLKTRNPEMSDEEGERILGAQTDNATRIENATHVIWNNGSLADLHKAVKTLISKLT